MRRLVPETHVSELQVFDIAEVFRVQGFGLGLLLHQVFKVVERCFCFPVTEDDVANFLQGTKNEKRENLHGYDFTWIQSTLEHQPHQHKHNQLPQGVDKGTLHKADAANALHLGEFQLEDIERVFVEALDFLFGQAEAFH